MRLRSLLLLLAVALTPVKVRAQSTDRFAIAAGQALPTQSKFAFFPTVRAEWYITPPNRPLGLLADAYLARAFPNMSDIGTIGRQWYRGTAYGGALSLVLQTRPRAAISPYFVAGILHRVTSERDSTSTPPSYGVSWGTESATEPNVGIGTRLRLPSGHFLRFELRYYDGLVFVPFTVGLSF